MIDPIICYEEVASVVLHTNISEDNLCEHMATVQFGHKLQLFCEDKTTQPKVFDTLI